MDRPIPFGYISATPIYNLYSRSLARTERFPMHHKGSSSFVHIYPETFFSQPTPHRVSSVSDPSPRSESLKRDFAVGRSALVVDDVSDVTEMLSVLLTHAGYEVVSASSARAALEAVHRHHFDVIISDIGMPEMNGYQLAREIRQLPDYATVPMVAVTGYSMFDDKQRSLSAGFNAHLTKPIDPKVLLDLIEHL
jgi:CheY-like chemotaxis protein